MVSSSGFALGSLRRLLCAHSAGNADDNAPGHLLAPEPEEGRSPCIVARLMDLDAMPAEATQPQPLRRSRSASSAEGGRSPSRGLCDGAAATRPPAVRASASLREKPAYLRPENDMFLLLSFSPDLAERDAEKAVPFLLASDDARPDGAKKQRSGRRRKLRFGDDEAESSSSGRRECNAQALSSSPVSVLDARDVHEESSTTTTSSSLDEVDPCSATSDEAQFALEQQSSTTKLHTNSDQVDDMSPARSTVHASRCSERERRNRRMVNKSEVITPDVTSIWQPICRAVEEDLRNMEWLTRDGADVVAEMESDILDQLICEAAAELVHLCSHAVCALPLPSPVSKEMFRQDKQLEVTMSKKHSGKARNWRLLNMIEELSTDNYPPSLLAF